MKKTIASFLVTTAGLAACSCGSADQTKNIPQQKDTIMTIKNFSTGFLVDQSPEQVFNAINNVRGWWSQNIEGPTDKPGSVFNYHYKDIHTCRIKITELIPGKKVVWRVMDNHFNFIRDKNEWIGNTIIFEIGQKENRTSLQFTQVGLTQEYECYNICHDAWSGYINKSLHSLVTTGKGDPTLKDSESGFNEQLQQQYNTGRQ